MQKITKTYLFLLLACIGFSSKAQSTFSLEALTIAVHPFEKPNYLLFENALDADGNFTMEPGLIFSYETFVRDNWASFQFTTSIFSDAAGQMAGFTDINFRIMFYHKWRSSLYLGVGPGISYRNSWSRITYGDIIYTPETKYWVDGNWEIYPTVVGKLEYDIFLGSRSDISLGIYYGHSFQTTAVSLGYRYWISTKVKHTKKCDCKDKYKKKFWDWF